MLIVQKYGGSSLADVTRIRNAARRIAEAAGQGHRLVVVVSAQGDTTDELIEKAQAITPKPGTRELDAYLSAGEQLSAGLMVMALEDMGVPAVSLTGWQAGLLTDCNHGDARIYGLHNHRVMQELENGNVVVVAGFQGISPENNVTTLGRGGSDTTAVALAAFLKADVCQIYTDVDGVYEADPRRFPDARRYDRLSYDKMLALIANGAQVLHDRCVELAKAYGLSIEVLSSFTDTPGTVVGP